MRPKEESHNKNERSVNSTTEVIHYVHQCSCFNGRGYEVRIFVNSPHRYQGKSSQLGQQQQQQQQQSRSSDSSYEQLRDFHTTAGGKSRDSAATSNMLKKSTQIV
jgi:hypothetical protein